VQQLASMITFLLGNPGLTGDPGNTTARNQGRARISLIAARTMALAGAALCATIAVSSTAQAQRPVDGDIVAQHGDWQVVCKPPPPGSKNKVCALVQSVTAQDRNNVGLTVYFQKFTNGTRVLRVFAPLGILLPPGLGLKIDGKDVGNAPFLRCHTFACYAQVVVKEDLAKRLSSGKTAIFVIFQTEEAGIGIPISLAGFAKGLAALK
jgi:invasion protein IalB